MNFCSDNVTGISPAILAAIAEANDGPAMPYGDDAITKEATQKITDLFETDAEVFLLGTGTAANALALSTMTPPYGSIFAHKEAHVSWDETGAPEFYTNGAKMIPFDGENGKIIAEAIEQTIAAGRNSVHQVLPSAISITQSTEFGAVYTIDEVTHLCTAAKKHNMRVHMDGARFANAVAATSESPADMTWRCGVDALTFGATKNGAMAAEAVIFFDKTLAENFGRRRKRGGQLFSKMRFIAAQWNAYLSNDLWLTNARHANKMANLLAEGLEALDNCTLTSSVEANEVFAQIPEKTREILRADGFLFYDWPGGKENLVRLVTAFDTNESDIERFLKISATTI
jgi:threonine aldolase